RDRNVTGVQTCALPICLLQWAVDTRIHLIYSDPVLFLKLLLIHKSFRNDGKDLLLSPLKRYFQHFAEYLVEYLLQKVYLFVNVLKRWKQAFDQKKASDLLTVQITQFPMNKYLIFL